MNISNKDIADKLLQLAQLLQQQGENAFKVKAYRNAARTLRDHPEKISDLVRAGGDVTTISGVGKGIESAITEIVSSGSLAKADKLSQDLPSGVIEISAATGITLKEAERIVKKLKVTSVETLRVRLEKDSVVNLLGTKLLFKVRSGLNEEKRMLWWSAVEPAESFKKFLASNKGVTRVEIAGSFRRRKETVGTLKFVVCAHSPAATFNAVKHHGGVDCITGETSNRLEGVLANGLRFVVQTADDSNWGDALVAETGSRAHLKKVSEQTHQTKILPSASELEWHKRRGMQMIEPELREDRGEVEASLRKKLPTLVSTSDIRGDLHCHSTASDGSNTIAEMVTAAKARGYSYLAITDHSQSLKITNGLDPKRLRAQAKEIEQLNLSSTDFRILKGSEVDILEDGKLDFSDTVLSQLDIVVCSIHSKFNLDRKQQTARLIKAIENPYMTILGHMTGRLLLRRPGYEVDVTRVVDALVENNKFIEINASPNRLDINDETVQRATEMGIKIAISTDAHSTDELNYISAGINQGRRGWLRASNVLNALPLAGLERELARSRNVRPRKAR